MRGLQIYLSLLSFIPVIITPINDPATRYNLVVGEIRFLNTEERSPPLTGEEVDNTVTPLIAGDFLPRYIEELQSKTNSQLWRITASVQMRKRPDGLPPATCLFVKQYSASFSASLNHRNNYDLHVKHNSLKIGRESIAVTRLTKQLKTYISDLSKQGYSEVLDKYLYLARRPAEFVLDLRKVVICQNVAVQWKPLERSAFEAENHYNILASGVIGRIGMVKSTDDPYISRKQLITQNSQWFPLVLEGSTPLEATNKQSDNEALQAIFDVIDTPEDLGVGYSCQQSELFGKKKKKNLCVFLGEVGEGPFSAAPADGLPIPFKFSNINKKDRFQLQCLGNYPPGTVAVYLEGRTDFHKNQVNTEWMVQMCDESGWNDPKKFIDIKKLKAKYVEGQSLYNACNQFQDKMIYDYYHSL